MAQVVLRHSPATVTSARLLPSTVMVYSGACIQQLREFSWSMMAPSLRHGQRSPSMVRSVTKSPIRPGSAASR